MLGKEPKSLGTPARPMPVLPPPPEIPSPGGSGTLVWRPASPDGSEAVPARHPLLTVASQAPVSEPARARRAGLRASLGSLLHRGRAEVLGLAPEDFEDEMPPRLRRGDRPLVLVVAGGRGGAGRSTLALVLARSLAGPGAGFPPVLLVDADPLHPDIDLLLPDGGREPGREPEARLDHLLLRLPELADGRLRLDQLLWTQPGGSLRALLAPLTRAGIGREHLDYLFSYLLAPGFDALVVDGGQLGSEPDELARFWLDQADAVLLPVRSRPGQLRSALADLDRLSGLGMAAGRCRLVLGLERGEPFPPPEWRGGLSGLALLPWPWSEPAARGRDPEAGGGGPATGSGAGAAIIRSVLSGRAGP